MTAPEETLSFPKEGYFYILSRKHGFALDVYDGKTNEGAQLIVWPQKFEDSDNQLWSFENHHLVNKKSGHAIDISSSAFKKDKYIVQKKIAFPKQSQEWIYDQGFICSKEYPTLVLDIKGGSDENGTKVILYKRKETENINQLWLFEPYHQYENALNIATTSVPLHKKEGFGHPRPGYAAEVGCPPELKMIPENNNIAGVGNNVSPSTSANGPGNSRLDPALAQYGSFYGGTPTISQPPAQPGPPPLPYRNDNQYPPSATYDYPSPPQPGYPPSMNNNNQYSAPPPKDTDHYPPEPGFYLPPQPSRNDNPAPPSYPNNNTSAYQPSASDAYTSSPPGQFGYPSPPQPYPHTNDNTSPFSFPEPTNNPNINSAPVHRMPEVDDYTNTNNYPPMPHNTGYYPPPPS